MIHRAFVILALALPSAAALAADPGQAMPQYTLTIKDHKFQPSQLTAPANTRFKVLVHNQDSTPSEFESSDFNREKIVLPGSQITVFVGPLGPGKYKFFDDFHQDTGQGVLIVQ